MKKLIIFLFTITMLFSLAACGEGSDTGSKSPGTDSTDTEGTGKNYTATVTPPAGWTIVESEYPLVQYGNDKADGFWIRKPTKGDDASTAADSYKTTETQDFNKDNWEEMKDVKVGEYDAKNLTYTNDISGIKQTWSVYFVAHDGNIFIIVCQSGLSDFDALKNDFDAFLSSFTIKEV